MSRVKNLLYHLVTNEEKCRSSPFLSGLYAVSLVQQGRMLTYIANAYFSLGIFLSFVLFVVLFVCIFVFKLYCLTVHIVLMCLHNILINILILQMI